jgi:hypothetical protein
LRAAAARKPERVSPRAFAALSMRDKSPSSSVMLMRLARDGGS